MPTEPTMTERVMKSPRGVPKKELVAHVKTLDPHARESLAAALVHLSVQTTDFRAEPALGVVIGQDMNAAAGRKAYYFLEFNAANLAKWSNVFNPKALPSS